MYSILRNDGAVIYSPAQIDDRPAYGAHLTQELNQAGNLSFSILPGHPLYSVLKPMETYLSAFDDEEEMFYGRVISVDDPVFTGTRNIECEGAYAFLEDADMPPDPKSSSGSSGVSQSASEFFTRCINTYNSSVNDSRRQFVIGTISHGKASQVDTYSISSYTSVKSCLESMLLNKLGGFIRIRSGQNGTHIIDWIEDYGVTDASEIEIGENVLDQTTRMSVENFFTVIRPVGADGLLLPEETLNVFGSDEMNRYGRIIKTITYSDIKNVTDLRTKANALIARINDTVFINTEIKLIDMHYIDGTTPKIHLGDSFTNIHGLENIKMTVANLERDFENPANDHIGFKNEKDLEVSDLDGSSRGGTGKSGSRSAVGGYGQRFKFISEDETNLYLHAEEIRINADKKLELTANEIELVSTREREDRGNIYEIQGSGVYVNGDHINAICGKYTISKDGKTITLVDGTDFIVTPNGANISVGTAIVDHAHGIDEIQGSALWTERNHITAVSGKYRIGRVEDPDHPGQYIEKLIVMEGGGFFLERNGAEFGLYDEGNLTGGVMVEKLNDNTVTTHIKGDRVIVGTVDDQTAQTMQSKFGELDGLVASKATIGQLNALSARVGDIEADYINTSNLSAGIASIEDVNVKKIHSDRGSAIFHTVSATNKFLFGGTDCFVSLGIRQIQVVSAGSNQYKLQYKTYADLDEGNEWQDAGTFDRAGSVTLSGSWTGSKYTVTATNATNSISIGFTQDSDVQLSVATNGTPTQSSSSILTQPVRVIQTQGTTQTDRWTGNLTINASDVYDSGFNAGESSVTLSGAWSGSKYTVSSSNSHSISIGFTQDSDVQLSVATNGTPTQSEINPAILTQPMRVIQTQGTTQTNRWTGNITVDAGDVYESGETDGQNDVRIVKGSWSGGIVSFRKSVGTADTKTVQLTSGNVSWNTSTNVGYVNIWDGTAADSEHGVSTGYTVSVDASSRYEAGVSDGKDAVGITFGEWEAGKITFDKTEGRSTPRIVCLSAASPTWSGNTASVKIRDYFSGDTSGNRRETGYTVTVDATPCYTDGYTTGRRAGLSAAKIKRGSWLNGQLNFQISEDGSDNYESVYIIPGDVVWSGNTGTIVIYEWVDRYTRYDTGLRVTVDASGASSASYNQGYTAGINAVTINKGSWSGGQITFSKSTGTASNRTVQLSAGTVSWSNNTASVPIKDTSSNVNTGYTVSVNATARYNAGVTAGKNAVTVVKGSWSGGQITFSKSEGTANNKTITLAKGTVSWNGTTVSIPILDSSASTGYTVSVDASGKLQSATYTSNGTYTPSSGYIGIKSVTVNVPTGGGSISGISINNPTFYDSQASLPSVDATLTTMGTLINRYKNNRGYIYFNVTMSGVSGSKKYRIPIGS